MKPRSQSSRHHAFTLLEIMIVVTIIGLLAVIAVCNYVIARDTSRLTVIRSNLREIEHAKEQWAIENHKGTGSPVDDVGVLNGYFRQGGLKVVVQETYQPNPVGTPSSAALPPDVKLGPYGPGAIIPAP